MRNLAIFLALTCFVTLYADDEAYTINYAIKLECPPSAERDALENLIPPPEFQSPNREEWVSRTINELEHVIALIRSGHFKTGCVNFGSDGNTEIDLTGLQHVQMTFHVLCKDGPELEALKHAKTQIETKKNLKYSEWAASAMGSLHQLQMLILKDKVVSVKSQRIDTEQSEVQGDSALADVQYTLDLKAPISLELQALLEVMPQERATFRDDKEWSIAIINTMHKLEMLILSGKINRALTDIEITDPTQS